MTSRSLANDFTSLSEKLLILHVSIIWGNDLATS